jgi:hypothetical protein
MASFSHIWSQYSSPVALCFSSHRFFTESVLHDTFMDATQPFALAEIIPVWLRSGWYEGSRCRVCPTFSTEYHTSRGLNLFCIKSRLQHVIDKWNSFPLKPPSHVLFGWVGIRNFIFRLWYGVF